jgi:drug/metabolite transporter (DMT)-like permease
MSLLALALVLVSAGAHATWNYLAKSAGDKALFTWSFVALSSVLYIPLVGYYAARSPMPPEGWIYAVGTMVLHVVYFTTLTASYTRGDLSVVYPVARGTGIALTPIVAALALGERVSVGGGLAIGVIILGVVVAHTRGRGAAALGGLAHSLRSPGSQLALLTGVVIAAYSTWDKQGVSLVAPPIYIYFVFLGQALVAAPYALRRWDGLRREVAKRPIAVVAAAILSPLAYLLVLVAMTFSPVSYIAAAREVGIVFGALLGALVLKEPHVGNRLAGGALIVLGVLGLAIVA